MPILPTCPLLGHSWYWHVFWQWAGGQAVLAGEQMGREEHVDRKTFSPTFLKWVGSGMGLEMRELGRCLPPPVLWEQQKFS